MPFFLCSMLPIQHRTSTEGFYFIQIALSAYPAHLSQHTWMTTFAQARRIPSTSILTQCPASKSLTSLSTIAPSHKVPPFFLSLTWKKVFKIHDPKTKTTTFLLVCTCIMKIQNFFQTTSKFLSFQFQHVSVQTINTFSKHLLLCCSGNNT